MKIDRTWTLFLDRDGVINTKLKDAYVRSWQEFQFIEGTQQALARLARQFMHIIIVTNQQGIGKGIMTADDLAAIHHKMLEEIDHAGGRIDKIYYCPDLDGSGSICRKPETGMALIARSDFPGISFTKSVMAGDSLTDMQFGRNCGMVTVFIGHISAEIKNNSHLIDYNYKNLNEFCNSLTILD